MASNQSLHMNHGDGEASYARNSIFQSAEQNRMKRIVEDAVASLLKYTNTYSSVVIADLGCSSGPNALALVSLAADAIFHQCVKHEKVPPEVCVFLNDLPGNDFNNVAKSLVTLQQSAQNSGLFVAGIIPGSFYNMLFTSNSLHLVFASNSVHWLSEAPEYLKKNEIPMYDNDDNIRRARRPLVLEGYARQLRKDFTLFLNLRAQDLAPGGHVVISLPGRCASDLSSQSDQPWDFVAFTLNDMASRGVINREMFGSFYILMYGPSDKELREIIQDESSFEIDKMQVNELMSGMDKGLITPKVRALAARAAFEPIIVQHFGRQLEEVMDEFMKTIERAVSTAYAAACGRSLVFLCVSLTKKI